MPVSETYDFYVPEARRLADLLGIRADVNSVLELIKTFLSYGARGAVQDLWLRNALCIAALTTYGRTFGSGVRNGVTLAFIEKLGDERLAAHKYFKDLRDKWAAHSSSNLEGSGITLQAHIDEQGRMVVSSIGERHRNTAVLSGADMQRLGYLCEALGASIQREIEIEKERLLGIARNMDLSVLASDPAAFAIPDRCENHAVARPRYGD